LQCGALEPAKLNSAKKFFVALVGGTVLSVGIAILATEFLWARRALQHAKGAVAKARRRSGLRAWLRRRRERHQTDT
jgi:hypothetical protein